MNSLKELKELTLHDMRETANAMSDEELDALHDEAESLYYPDLLTYPEFRETMKDPQYTGKDECFVGGCKQPAYYEGGDARYWCGMCEEHAGIRYRYVFGLVYGEDSIRRKIKFNLGDHQCQNSKQNQGPLNDGEILESAKHRLKELSEAIAMFEAVNSAHKVE